MTGNKSAVIIGAGIGGIATAVYLAKICQKVFPEFSPEDGLYFPEHLCRTESF